MIEEAVKTMLFDINNYESLNYIVKYNKIGHINQGNIVFNAIYGYKTTFAYYKEYTSGQITEESLKSHKRIYIKCGKFSYAEIASQFHFVMEVTGTLRHLSDPEKQLIKTAYE